MEVTCGASASLFNSENVYSFLDLFPSGCVECRYNDWFQAAILDCEETYSGMGE